MIARLWRATIDVTRSGEYEAFARERSLPTFSAHGGFLGCSFLGDGEERSVLTLWNEPGDVDALERSTMYRETVDAIMSAGFVLEDFPAVVAPVLET